MIWPRVCKRVNLEHQFENSIFRIMDDDSNNTVRIGTNNDRENDHESFASALIGQIHNSWFTMPYSMVHIACLNRIKRHNLWLIIYGSCQKRHFKYRKYEMNLEKGSRAKPKEEKFFQARLLGVGLLNRNTAGCCNQLVLHINSLELSRYWNRNWTTFSDACIWDCFPCSYSCYGQE